MAYQFAGRFGVEGITDSAGNALPAASVLVKTTAGATATLYTSRLKAATSANPISPDAAGNISFYADPGEYDLAVTVGLVVSTKRVAVPIDPDETLVAVNVKAYGALGNYSANETDEIHAARDAAGVGGRVYFPNGTYLHDGLVNNQAGQVWELAPDAVLRLRNAGNTHTVTLAAAGAAIVGGTVDGNKANQTPASEASGVFISADDCRVEGVEIINAMLCGIQPKNVNRPQLLRNKITACDYVGILAEVKAAHSGDVVDIVIEGNHVDRSSLGTGVVEGGIKVHGDTTRLAIGCKILGNTVRMPASPVSDAAICIETHGGAPRSVVADNTTYGGAMGVSLSTSDNSSCTGNTAYGASLVGFEGAQSVGAAYTGNTVDGGGLTLSGFQFSNATVGHLTITGNTVKNLAAAAKCLYANAANDLTIVGNDFDIGAGNHCISLQNVLRFTITGNTLTGTTGSFDGVSLDGASYKGAITGNTFIGLQRAAFFISASSAVTFTDLAFVGNTLLSCVASVATGLSGGAALGANIVVRANVGEPKDWWDYANNLFDSSTEIRKINSADGLRVQSNADGYPKLQFFNHGSSALVARQLADNNGLVYHEFNIADGGGDMVWRSGSGFAERMRLLTGGDLKIQTVGKGLQIKEGSNAKMGTAVLVAGVATVATTAVTANSRIFLTSQVDGGTNGFLRVTAKTAATSFVITSSNAADTSTVAWLIFEPA